MAHQALDDAALLQALVDGEHELVRARFAHSMGRLQNTASLSDYRRNISRIRTEIRAREIAQGLSKGALSGRAAGIAPSPRSENADQGGFLDSLVDGDEASE